MKSIKNYLIGTLEKENRTLKRQMSKNRKSLKNPIPVSFTAEIILEGKHNVKVNAPTIESAIEKALSEYKAMNIRDILGYWQVMANFTNGNSIELPKKLWGNILKTKEKK